MTIEGSNSDPPPFTDDVASVSIPTGPSDAMSTGSFGGAGVGGVMVPSLEQFEGVGASFGFQQAEQSPLAPPLIPPSLTNNRHGRPLNVQYQLKVVQHPKHARMCGFGEKDRRPVDPPPVVQLVSRHPDGHFLNLSASEHPFLVCHCALFSSDGLQDQTIVQTPHSAAVPLTNLPTSSSSSAAAAAAPAAQPPPAATPNTPQVGVMSPPGPSPHAQYTRSLVGSLVSTPFNLRNEEGEEGVYFIFGDLSVRTEGWYRLKFMLCNLVKWVSLLEKRWSEERS
ncbi:hypothetical protein HK097_000688 [Rhizophlyctis rosea]|uniref:Velvet domain-containing protein n=1 Tax=Rhizophlyctis rosea TaxID=64517 RepID=A0AAD5S711_9FUNG|nr:hypothetical protein HK097_000688 [Rhizophlyctis rosea]